MSKLPGTVVVLSGPTAVGKSTVGDAILAAIPEATRVITATTRKPRANEKDGVDYHFHSKEEFLVGIARDEFLEHAEVHGYFFGTPKDQVDAAVERV
ncbi:MAG: hypothetical protein KDB07_02300 [Planctomycetes bacterium]|nr:hypothetical protein [Planctomycetota bacterium]